MNSKIHNMSPAMLKALSALEQDALIDLWELDLRKFGGEVLRFTNTQSETGNFVLWKNQQYQSYPILADGFEWTGQGVSNRPKITVSNAYGLITGLVEKHQQMIGATLIRRQVYAQFLDAANFTAGNPKADSNQEIVSKYVIERLSSLNAETAVFELAAPSEADGAVIPARVMLANVCVWQYRGEECGYRGRAVADKFGNPTQDMAQDDCGRRLLDCQARFGATAVLPFGGFVSCDKVN